MKSSRFHSSAGIAIGPILFILAILALLAAVMASGGGDFQVAGAADSVTNNVVAQANLIRSTINQCNLQYSLAVSTGSVPPTNDPYPSPSGATLVSALQCNPLGTTSLWSDKLLPPPNAGFNPWKYIDDSTAGGGRCFWTAPSGANPSTSGGITSGLSRAASKFNSSSSYTTSAEVLYDPASSYQKFVVWITLPTGTMNTNCDPTTAY